MTLNRILGYLKLDSPAARKISGLWAGALVIFVASVVLFAPIAVTLDGYSHLYHAQLMRSMLLGQAETQAYLAWGSPLLPNWLGPLTLAALASILPGQLALKLLLVGGFLLLLAALARLTRVAASMDSLPAHAYVILTPIALNGFFAMGFIGFVISAALSFLVLSIFLNPRFPQELSKQALVAALLLTAYFFHPFPVFVSLLFPLAHIAAWGYQAGGAASRQPLIKLAGSVIWPWIPVGGLAASFYVALSSTAEPQPYSIPAMAAHRLRLIAEPETLSTLAPSPTAAVLYILMLGAMIAVLFAKRASAEETSRRSSLILAAVLGAMLVSFLVGPDGVGDGSLIPERLLLFAISSLTVLALARAMFDLHLLFPCFALASCLVVAFGLEYLLVAKRLEPSVREVKEVMSRAPSGSTTLVLSYRVSPACEDWALRDQTVPERHWAMIGAVESDLIVLNEYQPTRSHFPLHYRENRFKLIKDEILPESDANVADWTAALTAPGQDPEYVVVWGVPNAVRFCPETVEPPLVDALSERFDRVSESKGASYTALWRRRPN